MQTEVITYGVIHLPVMRFFELNFAVLILNDISTVAAPCGNIFYQLPPKAGL